MENTAAIDFSLSSTGITVFNKVENYYKFYAISKGFPKKHENFIKSCLTDCIILKQDEIKDIIFYTNWVENILSILTTNNVKHIGIEGYSFNSISSSFTKIAEVTGILKFILNNNHIEFDIIQPTSAKKLAGNGRYNKSDMFNAFLNNVLNDGLLINTDFYKNIKEENSNVKPLEDVIDSYFILKYLEQTFNT